MSQNLTRRAFGVAAAAVSMTALAACSGNQTPASAPAADSIEVAHAQGTTTVPGSVNRIVVLDMGALDTLTALGLTDKVVGLPKANVPAPLKQYEDDKYADVGTLAEPDLEEINKLKPDLVIVGFRSAKHQPALAKHFPTIDCTFAYEGGFAAGVEQAATIVATAVGKQAEVAPKIAELTKALDDAKAAYPAGTKALVLMTTGGKATVQGKDGRFGVVFHDVALTPAIPEANNEAHGDALSFEAVQKANPDVMFVCDRDAAIGEEGKAAKEVLDNELVATTNAWKNGKVIYLDGARWYIMIHGLDNAIAMAKGLTQSV